MPAEWDDAFGAVFGTKEYRYLIDSVPSSIGQQIESGTVAYSSHFQPGYVQCIARNGHAITGPSVSIGEWSSRYGAATIRLAMPNGLDPRRPISAALGVGPRRGAIVAVRIGLRGWAPADYVTVFQGPIRDIVRVGYNQWALQISSMLSMLNSRNTNSGVEYKVALFGDQSDNSERLFLGGLTRRTTTLRASYTKGDALIAINSTAGHVRQTGGVYVMRITPASGEPFYMTGGSIIAGPSYFSVSVVGRAGTLAVDASIGDLVEQAYGFSGHPLEIARKLCMSTGVGTNGTYDTLPEYWGVGLDQAFFDGNDMDSTQALNFPTGNWFLAGYDLVENPLSFMQGWLEPAGYYFTERQGLITIRCALAPLDFYAEQETLTDDEIADFSSYSAFSPETPSELTSLMMVSSYDNGSVDGGGNYILDTGYSFSIEESITRPMRWQQEGLIEYIDTDVALWRADIVHRCGPWLSRIPDAVTIKVVGFRLAKMAPGSGLIIDSQYLSDRNDYKGVPWYVTSVEPNWFEGYTVIRACFVSPLDYLA